MKFTTGSDNFSKITRLLLAVAIAAMLSFFPIAKSTNAQSCLASTGTWSNKSLSRTSSGSFRITYDVTPLDDTVDAVSGLSSGDSRNFSSLATAVRFNSRGTIDVRDGSKFTAASAIPYLAGATYPFIFDVNVAAHTYSAYVILRSMKVSLGNNLAFRSEQANVGSLNTVGMRNSRGAITVCNIAVSAVAPGSNATSALIASAAKLDFGKTSLSNTNNQYITLTNVGRASLTISEVMVAGAGFNAGGGAAGLTLRPGQTTQVTASFTPPSEGNYAGTITISDSSGIPVTVALSGTGAQAGTHRVTLSWDAEPNHHSKLLGYDVYVSTTSGGPYSKLTAAPVNGTTFTDAGVQSGETYYYVVTTVNYKSESRYSSEVQTDIP